MPAYAIVLSIPSTSGRLLTKGAVFLSGTTLPLWCDVMPWFELAPGYTDLLLRLDIADVTLNIPITEIELVSLGPITLRPQRLPAHEIADTPELLRLHFVLHRILTKSGCIILPPQQVADAYRPHVVDRGAEKFFIGSRHKATSVVILERLDRGKITAIDEASFS